MNCEYLKDGRCGLAELLAMRELEEPMECHVQKKVCQCCLRRGKPSDSSPSPECMSLVKPPMVKLHLWKAFLDFRFQGKVRGLGDRVAKLTELTGINKLVKAAAKAAGKDCGCAKRQAALNKKFPKKNERKPKGGGRPVQGSHGDHPPGG